MLKFDIKTFASDGENRNFVNHFQGLNADVSIRLCSQVSPLVQPSGSPSKRSRALHVWGVALMDIGFQFLGGSSLENVREFCNSIGQEPRHYETYRALTNRIAELSDIF